MRRALIIAFTLIIFALVLALVLLNLREVEVNYLVGTASLPLAAALAAVLVVGAIVGALAALPAAFGARARRRRLEKKLREAEREIEALKQAPLHDAR